MTSLVLSLLVFTTVNMAHAQTVGMSASTDRQSYEPGDKVTIHGSVSQLNDENPVTIIVRNPIGNVYEVGQVPLTSTSFSHSFSLGDDAQGGLYTVNIRQDDKISQIQFQVIAVQIQIIPVSNSEIRVSGKDTGLVKYGNVEISPADTSLTIPVDASKVQNGSITEQYRMSKQVIDTTNDQLAIKENGISTNCNQTRIGAEWIVECPISRDVHDLTMIGTSVIPEFGTMSTIILTLGIVITLAVFAQNKLFAKPR